MNDRNFAYYLTRYFSVYLPGDRGLSPHTIASYRDTFKQLLNYMKEIQNTPPQKMMLELFTGQVTRQFLNHLEKLGKSVSTRNQRLTAIKAFTKCSLSAQGAVSGPLGRFLLGVIFRLTLFTPLSPPHFFG